MPSENSRPDGTDTGVHRVLVLMATFNGAQWIRAQLLSVWAQQGVEITLVVNDDGSSDGTLAHVRACSPTDHSTQILQFPQPSGSAAQNFFRIIQAVDARGYDFVALADQDDIWHHDKLHRAIATLSNTDAVGYSSAVRAFWDDGRTALLTQSPATTVADYVFEGAGQGCTFVLRSGFFADIQRFLAANQMHLALLHYHDWAIYALCRALQHDWHFDDTECMRYRQHSSNDTGARSGRDGIFKRLALIRSGWYGAQTEHIARLCVAVAGESATGAARYLDRLHGARQGWSGRLALCMFVLTSGRRRWSDRLVLTWAALSGKLATTPSPNRP